MDHTCYSTSNGSLIGLGSGEFGGRVDALSCSSGRSCGRVGCPAGEDKVELSWSATMFERLIHVKWHQ